MTSYAVQIKGGSRSPVNSFRTTIQRATPAIHLNYFIAKDISARSYFARFDKKLIRTRMPGFIRLSSGSWRCPV